MSLLLEHRATAESRPTRRARRRLRRTLRSQDQVAATLAELFRIDEVLAEARAGIERGWLQHGWFTYATPSGASITVTVCTPWAVRKAESRQVTATCLVGAIVQAGGGPSRARSQLVQRTLDLTWHTLFRGDREQVRWCPSSPERAGHMIDLVSWNDHSGRTAADVLHLLDETRDRLHAEVERARDRQRDLNQALTTEPVAGG